MVAGPLGPCFEENKCFGEVPSHQSDGSLGIPRSSKASLRSSNNLSGSFKQGSIIELMSILGFRFISLDTQRTESTAIEKLSSSEHCRSIEVSFFME
jgi:hypothetical protein